MGQVNTRTTSDKEIDRPLGMSTPRAGARVPIPAMGKIIAATAILAVFAAATAISLREQPFRAPTPVAVSTP
jgi:uncharacterized protein